MIHYPAQKSLDKRFACITAVNPASDSEKCNNTFMDELKTVWTGVQKQRTYPHRMQQYKFFVARLAVANVPNTVQDGC